MSTLPTELALIVLSAVPADTNWSSLDVFRQLQECDFQQLLTSAFAKTILGINDEISTPPENWGLHISSNIDKHCKLSTTEEGFQLLALGIAALNAFFQATVTGPPLPFTDKILLSTSASSDKLLYQKLSQASIQQLSLDGEDVYHLLPYPILFTLAKIVLNHKIWTNSNPHTTLYTLPWWRIRVNFLHQRILSDQTTTLHNEIYSDLEVVSSTVLGTFYADKWIRAQYLIERAMINNFHNYDTKARKMLEAAAQTTGLMYAMTGRLGKRTKFQIDDITQLVLLAKSRDDFKSDTEGAINGAPKPKTLDLNDDTLLEQISFTPVTTNLVDEDSLPKALSTLSLEDPPTLHPIDATILLLLTETIKNTSPADGITREQMFPYAERVLKHSTNWTIHSFGLLVRSRLEGYKTRTMERSVLQLQVVVDQVIAETTRHEDLDGGKGVNTFLPRPKEEESAPVRERLRYIHQMPVPTRWEIESELAGKWVNMGGLRTALEIYERLEMWAEVALCWGAVDKEDKAIKVIRALLYDGPMPSANLDDVYDDEEDDNKTNTGTNDDTKTSTTLRDPPPPSAPRLWCILGDLEKEPKHYEKSWEVSGCRFARAQRSLGRLYIQQKNYKKAVESYLLSLKVNPLNTGSWFAYGCALLELSQWDAAVEAFSRVVSIDDQDAEGWSNLATAILRREPQTTSSATSNPLLLDDEEAPTNVTVSSSTANDKNRNKRDALTALKRAVRLKHDSWRIWENMLIIAASMNPPATTDVCIAIKRIIDLRGTTVGEACIDEEILDMLVRSIINADMESATPTGYDPSKPGLNKMVVELVDTSVTPLITMNPALWHIVARLAIWRKKPSTALEAHEKAFRIVNAQYDLKQDRSSWDRLVGETGDLCSAYESFGEMDRTEGLGAGDGEVVMKNWAFKAKSAVRGVMGKGRKGGWDVEDVSGWERLEVVLEGIKK